MQRPLIQKTGLGVLPPRGFPFSLWLQRDPSPWRHPSRVILLICIVLTGCATFPGKQSTKTSTAKPGSVTTVKPPDAPPRDVMKPEAVRYADISNPKRQVSQQLVAQGKAFLAQKDYDQARSRLEEAISVDPTNGAAYYHLAVVYYDLKDYPKALGFLDQAETLLHTSPDWMETIQKFRELLST